MSANPTVELSQDIASSEAVSRRATRQAILRTASWLRLVRFAIVLMAISLLGLLFATRSQVAYSFELPAEFEELTEERPGEHTGEVVLSDPIEEEELESGLGSGNANPEDIAEIRRRLERENGQGGDVQVTLIWDNKNDLDLHVLAPSEEEIYYGNRDSLCGGILDIDMNVSPTTDLPVENVFWPLGESPTGEYVVTVKYFRRHVGQNDPTDFHVLVQVNGIARIFIGTLHNGDPGEEVVRFSRTGDRIQIGAESWDLSDIE